MKQTDAFPIPHRTRRTTFSLPTETLDRIERLSRRVGVSQSAFVAELLDEPLAVMASIMDALPETGATLQDVKRAKGRSVAFIKHAVGEALALVASFPATRPTQGGGATRVARGRIAAPQHSTHSQTVRPGESHRASATAATPKRSQRPTEAKARAQAHGRSVTPSRPRKTSGAPLKAGRRPTRGSTKR